jgi:hypothetical protein
VEKSTPYLERMFMEAENLSEYFYEQLKDTGNPGLCLARFYGETFQRNIGKGEVILFNRMLRLYGRFTLYFSILDMSFMKDINHENIAPLLSYFCKKSKNTVS